LASDPEEWLEIVGDGRRTRSVGVGQTAGEDGGLVEVALKRSEMKCKVIGLEQ